MPVTVSPVKKTAPLENGDRLNRKEFHRRYRKMHGHKKIELIEGKVQMASPVRFRTHSFYDGRVSFLFSHYVAKTRGMEFGPNTTVKLDKKNEFQPDQVLFIDSAFGGTLEASKYLVGAPDFVAEISGSSVSIDLNEKTDVYLRNGVREYLVIRVYDEEIDWFVSRNGRFERILADSSGVMRSSIFPGLWIKIDALLKGDLVELGRTLDSGLATPEHAAFVSQLAAAQTPPPATAIIS